MGINSTQPPSLHGLLGQGDLPSPPSQDLRWVLVQKTQENEGTVWMALRESMQNSACEPRRGFRVGNGTRPPDHTLCPFNLRLDCPAWCPGAGGLSHMVQG